jgi:hypothetical protein
MRSVRRIAVAGVVLICVLSASFVIAGEGVVGEWGFKTHFEERTSTAVMTITKNAEGKLEGTWSAQWGESALSDITFQNGRFNTWGQREFKTTYEGTVEGKKLTGKGKSQWGESTFEGTLQGEPNSSSEAICGQWQMTITIPATEITEKLCITKNADGTLAGKWEAQRGENTISDVNFNAGKLTFTRKGKMGAMEWQLQFEGTVEGDQLKGVFMGEWGEREANATRITAAKPDEGKKADTNEPADSNKAEPKKPASEKKTDAEDRPT